MKIKPPSRERRIWILQLNGTRYSVSVNKRNPVTLHSFAAAKAEADALSELHDADVWVDDGQSTRLLVERKAIARKLD
jgi:hypothetical protein